MGGGRGVSSEMVTSGMELKDKNKKKKKLEHYIPPSYEEKEKEFSPAKSNITFLFLDNHKLHD
jgi:hypothetical protein